MCVSSCATYRTHPYKRGTPPILCRASQAPHWYRTSPSSFSGASMQDSKLKPPWEKSGEKWGNKSLLKRKHELSTRENVRLARLVHLVNKFGHSIDSLLSPTIFSRFQPDLYIWGKIRGKIPKISPPTTPFQIIYLTVTRLFYQHSRHPRTTSFPVLA